MAKIANAKLVGAIGLMLLVSGAIVTHSAPAQALPCACCGLGDDNWTPEAKRTGLSKSVAATKSKGCCECYTPSYPPGPQVYAEPLVIQVNGGTPFTNYYTGPVLSGPVNSLVSSTLTNIVKELNDARYALSVVGTWVWKGQRGWATMGNQVDLAIDWLQNGDLNFVLTLHGFHGYVYMYCSTVFCPDGDVNITADNLIVRGSLTAGQSQAQIQVSVDNNFNYSVNSGYLFGAFEGMIRDGVRSEVSNRLKAMVQSTNNVLGAVLASNNPMLTELIDVLRLPSTHQYPVGLRLTMDRSSGASQIQVAYEQSYSGSVPSYAKPPMRGFMFSSYNMQLAKAAMGCQNSSHFDSNRADEDCFFANLRSRNIRTIRSEVPWSAFEPDWDPYPYNPDSWADINRYINTHAAAYDALAYHYQRASDYGVATVVTVADTHGAPRVEGKSVYVCSTEPCNSEESSEAVSKGLSPVGRQTFLNRVKVMTRATVRRLNNEVHFWQIDNELNQADLELETTPEGGWKRSGAAWKDLSFLDAVFSTEALAVKAEDPVARLTHNFHPFRLHTVQDWAGYLDVIGLTFHANNYFAYPLLGAMTGDFINIARYFSGGTKPIWVLSAGYPGVEDGVAWYDATRTLDQNQSFWSVGRQQQFHADAIQNTGWAGGEAYLAFSYLVHPAPGPSDPVQRWDGLVWGNGTPKASYAPVLALLADSRAGCVWGNQTYANGAAHPFFGGLAQKCQNGVWVNQRKLLQQVEEPSEL